MNKCTFIGRIGKDPIIKQLNAGKMASFSIAMTEKWKDKQTGEEKKQTEWVNCVVFGNLVKVIESWVKKGDQIYIEGKFETKTYDTKEGVTKYATQINVKNVELLGSGKKNESSVAAGEPVKDVVPLKETGTVQNVPIEQDSLPF